MSAAVKHEQPVLPRIDIQRLDRLGQLRQLDLRFAEGRLTGEHIFFFEQRQHIQLRTTGAGEDQAVFMQAEVDVLQRPTFGVELQRCVAVRELQLRGDDFLPVRITRLVRMVQYQCLTVRQAHNHQRTARLALLQRGDLRTRWQW